MAWTQDPGIGSELALCLNYFLGMPGVLLALLPVSRSWLHEFILHKLTARETLDAILLASVELPPEDLPARAEKIGRLRHGLTGPPPGVAIGELRRPGGKMNPFTRAVVPPKEMEYSQG